VSMTTPYAGLTPTADFSKDRALLPSPDKRQRNDEMEGRLKRSLKPGAVG
jgi:hypothetical protein